MAEPEEPVALGRRGGAVDAIASLRQLGSRTDRETPSRLEPLDVNRSLATGTRLLFDRELKRAGVAGERISGYDREVNRHMDVGLEILSGRADAGPGIRPVASLLGLDFLPLRQERYDLVVTRERFFDLGVQNFLSLLHEKAFIQAAEGMQGYDVSISGKMIFPHELELEETE